MSAISPFVMPPTRQAAHLSDFVASHAIIRRGLRKVALCYVAPLIYRRWLTLCLLARLL